MRTFELAKQIRETSKQAFEIAKVYEDINTCNSDSLDLFIMAVSVDLETETVRRYLYKALSACNDKIRKIRIEFSFLINKSESNWLTKEQNAELNKISPIFNINSKNYID